jgi:dimeric dUTPase (all-alpha-NTP-PPase superfamily)
MNTNGGIYVDLEKPLIKQESLGIEIDLSKLFKMQKALDEHILSEHPELKGQNNLDWKILALLVETGECANEWRGFKKWSKDQRPRLKVVIKEPQGQCADVIKYPLLEEYVDKLHFILSIGLELQKPGVLSELSNIQTTIIKEKTIMHQFKEIMRWTLNVEKAFSVDLTLTERAYKNLLDYYLGLGEMLSFTWEQIEQAYFEKNAVNHQRQDNGY